ncbi:MAG: MFS transporter [Prevotella sp.]|jgi:MFS family permease
MMTIKTNKTNGAMTFILMFGIVSLFSDMTHESASSIRGAFLALLGASAATIGFVSGLGEMVGYGMRYVFGRITDRTRLYWPMVIAGYVIDIVAVPALALVGPHGWIAACALLIVQRMGKAIKKPAKDTIMSFAATQQGAGKSFAIQEMLDQLGAFLGPLLLYVIMLFKSSGSTFERYSFCFACLAIPGAITLILLWLTKRKFPNPENFEPDPKTFPKFKMRKGFILYIIGISCFAFGFIDYALVVMHISRTGIFSATELPLLYSGAMLIDALSALVFGWLFDRHGTLALIVSTLLSAPFPLLIFMGHSECVFILGILLWGIGMGAQESILKAAVATMVPKQSRATGYGLFECSFGVFWFLGSWLLGVLYDTSVTAMVAVSMGAQLAAIPFFLTTHKALKQPSHTI